MMTVLVMMKTIATMTTTVLMTVAMNMAVLTMPPQATHLNVEAAEQGAGATGEWICVL